MEPFALDSRWAIEKLGLNWEKLENYGISPIKVQCKQSRSARAEPPNKDRGRTIQSTVLELWVAVGQAGKALAGQLLNSHSRASDFCDSLGPKFEIISLLC